MSEEFENFLKLNGIKHIISSPYAASNGVVENSVKTFENLLLKEISQHGKEIYLNRSIDFFLMMYGITEHCSGGKTPSLLFLGRQIQSNY